MRESLLVEPGFVIKVGVQPLPGGGDTEGPQICRELATYTLWGLAIGGEQTMEVSQKLPQGVDIFLGNSYIPCIAAG